MNRKGQTFFVILMAYAWVVLVVLVAVGALVYFGVLTSEMFDGRCESLGLVHKDYQKINGKHYYLCTTMRQPKIGNYGIKYEEGTNYLYKFENKEMILIESSSE